MKLTLTKETLVELTADDMSAVIGGAGDSGSCSILSCVTNAFRADVPGGGSTPNFEIC